MKSIITKFFTKVAMVACLVTVFAGSALATDFTLTSATAVTQDGITISFAKGSGSTAPTWYSAGLRLYASNTITIESSNTITGVTFNWEKQGSKAFASVTANVGTYSHPSAAGEGTWTGSATSITFTLGSSGQLQLNTLSVTASSGGGSTLEDSDFAITGAPVSLSFDLYNNATAQTVNYTTSSAGTINIANSAYATFSINTSTKTITVTPTAVTPSAQTITVNQAADDTYKAGSGTFTITVSDSTPYVQPTEIEITPNYTFWGQTSQFSGNDYSSLSGSKDNVTLVWSKGIGSTYANQNAMRFYKDNSLTFTAPNGYEIKSIELEVSGTFGDLEFAPDGWDGSNTIWSGSSETVTMSRPSSASSYATISKFTITIGAPSTDPVISADNVNIAYNATAGEIAFTISNPVDGGTVSASTEATWLTLGSETASPISFTCAANSETTARTATVTLTYTYNTNETITKNVTVTQAASPVIYSTIPALFAAATSTETGVYVTFNNWVVSGVSTNGKNVYVTDNAGNGFIIYSSSDVSSTYHAGDVLSGTAVSCDLVLYKGAAEIKNLNASDLTITSGGSVSAVSTIAMASLDGVNTGAVVSYSNLTCSVENSKYYLSDGTTTLQLYNQLFAFEALTAGKQYNITGVYLKYDSTKEILPRNAADIEEVVVTTPSIIVAPATVNAPAAETTGTLDITAINLPISQMTDFAIQHYDDDDNEISEPAWIEVLVAEQDPQIGEGYVVSYYMLDNDDAARSAYFKVWALDANDNAVYSNLVTINQAEYVADYATLPFEEFTGGKSAIEGTPGLSYNGLGNDYSSAAKLRFDSTDDNLVLKINGSPSKYTLQFNIKGNPSSGSWSGTFKLQTSADGVVYNDIKVYSTLSNSTNGQVEKIDGFADNVRYFKWVYSDQTNGNVGVGKISLTRPNAETSIEVSASFNDGKYWATFFNSAAAYSLPAGAKAYTLNSSKQLYLLGNGSVIPANTAVIIIADAASITLDKVADPNPAIAISGTENILKGSNYGVVVGGIPSGVPYVLGIKTGVLNFYKFAGEAVPANKAYYIANE